MRAQMMDFPLTVTSIMRHARKVHGRATVASVTLDSARVESPAQEYTWGDAFRRVDQLGNALQRLGVELGERIATLAWNDHRHVELYFGIACLGAVCHTINPRLFPEQVAYIINHAEDQWLFVDPLIVPLVEKLQPTLPSVKGYVLLCDRANMPETGLPNALCYEELLAPEPEAFDWPELDENSAAGLCYTSGTTGDPKGVLYSHRSTVLHTMMIALPDVMGVSSRSVLMPLVPMFHVNAWGAVHVAAMTGANLVLPGPKMLDGEVISALINRYQVDYSLGVPTIWLALVEYLQSSGETVPSLQQVVVGGAACPESLKQALEGYGVSVHPGWGMTETSPLGAYYVPPVGLAEMSAEQQAQYRTKAGRAVFGVEMKIEDPQGNELPWDGDSAGELKVRGPWVAGDYYKLHGTDDHFDNGWFATGDVATIDSDGYMAITDRVKDVIKSGGEWISSIDVENAAMGHPAVAEAAVIGIPDPKWTERPLLVVVLRPDAEAGAGSSAESILESLQGKIADWWVPEHCVFVDQLPHTATGKVSKKTLREQMSGYALEKQ
ncbi:long-chain fatty acid--CoA ligase [Porticoccus sp. W117]|uniref:long-chain fatty acid--CoA ligase n=1 Tax=Porticoccus sp. W117 TaxID=3054777 RepID=UPI00259336F1|nr:long-chain fatty acid--CoA ligase [Porticoccus sp. W117]MDM3870553.1 long-chain fatty acid--CoA ligase [Porticoccus sp. W117]